LIHITSFARQRAVTQQSSDCLSHLDMRAE
jgi:hypothetical protein